LLRLSLKTSIWLRPAAAGASRLFELVYARGAIMQLKVDRSLLSGRVPIPASKSHTIRGLILASLAEGTSELVRPLLAADTWSCLNACRALGADVRTADETRCEIKGAGGRPHAPDAPIDVGNSGTTLFLSMGAAALASGLTEFTGDEQIRRRSATLLLEALGGLGATAYAKGPHGCAPLVVGGGLKGGKVSIECPTSQYLSSLLIACPLASGESEITVPLLNEKPYVEMTCRWLNELGVQFQRSKDLQHFQVPGGQGYPAFSKVIPADFSSATFFLVAAAITGSELFLEGLDMSDAQGDRAVVWMLEEMGAALEVQEGGVRIQGPERLQGRTLDLNATPDALPALTVAGAVAEGETKLLNVPQARQKETDRIAVMAAEMGKLGAQIDELPDGLVIRGGTLRGAAVHGHGDHRVVMALAVAGLAAEGTTLVDTAEAVSITCPTFAHLMRRAGARLTQA